MRRLKKYLIPHEENQYKPHLLRRKTLSFTLILFVALELLFLAGTLSIFKNSNFLAAVLPSILVGLTNESRVASDAPTLKVSPLLVRAAELKAEDMAAKGYFAHTSPEGRTPRYWLDHVGYLYLYAAENLAVNFTESRDVADAWMKSPAHKKNILNNNYTEIGIATARGFYKGQEATFVVQYFGQPALIIAQEGGVIDKVPELITDASRRSALARSDTQSVKGEELEITSAGISKRIFGSPRGTIAVMFLAVILLLIAVLLLAIVVKIKIQHPKMIIGTLIVIIIALCILLLNSRILTETVELPSDVEYASTFKAF